jgi:hypothetical protein
MEILFSLSNSNYPSQSLLTYSLYASSLSPEIIVLLSSTIVLPIIATHQENVSSTSMTIPKWKIAISSRKNLKSVGRTLSGEGRHTNTMVDPDTHHGPVAAY